MASINTILLIKSILLSVIVSDESPSSITMYNNTYYLMYQYEGNVPSFIIPSIINKSFTGTFNSDGCQLTLYNIHDKNTNITIPAIIRNININRDAENIISCILARSIFTKLR
jgi:hypothetical protein